MPNRGQPAPLTLQQCQVVHAQGRSLWKKCVKRPRRKNHNKQERPQRSAPGAPCRACSGTSGSCCPPCPPPWRWGTRRPCGTPSGNTRQKQLSCVLVVEHGQLVGVFTERDVVGQVAATPLDVDHAAAGRHAADPECLQLDDELVYALQQMLRGAYLACPRRGRTAAAHGLVSLQTIIDEPSRRSRTSSSISLRLPRTPSPPSRRARKAWARAPRRGSVARRGRVESPAGASLKEENAAMPIVRRVLREGQKKCIRRPGVHSYPGAHVTDYPESRQYRGISIRV